MVIGWLLISLQNNIFGVNHPIGQGSEDSVADGKSVIYVLLFFVWLRERVAGGHFGVRIKIHAARHLLGYCDVKTSWTTHYQ